MSHKVLMKVTARAFFAIVFVRAVRADARVGLPTKASGLSMAWIYILKTKSGKYYVGSTTDISERMRHHFGDHTPSTKSLGPEGLSLVQEYPTLKEARSVEFKIKKLKRKDYVEKMIQEGYIKLRP